MVAHPFDSFSSNGWETTNLTTARPGAPGLNSETWELKSRRRKTQRLGRVDLPGKTSLLPNSPRHARNAGNRTKETSRLSSFSPQNISTAGNCQLNPALHSPCGADSLGSATGRRNTMSISVPSHCRSETASRRSQHRWDSHSQYFALIEMYLQTVVSCVARDDDVPVIIWLAKPFAPKPKGPTLHNREHFRNVRCQLFAGSHDAKRIIHRALVILDVLPSTRK